MKPINILLLGAGGDIGQSIYKIMSEIKWIQKTVGTDININSASSLLLDKFYRVPKCNDLAYMGKISQIINEENISLILPVSEPEIRHFFQNTIESINNIPLILANSFSLSIGLDKLKTIEFLRDNNLPYPKTQKQNANLDLDYPIIAKSNKGSGSKSIIKIEDEIDLIYVNRKFPHHILQEFLPEDEGEYTCGLFCSSKGEIRHIIFKRDLLSGFSVFGEVVENESINQLLIKIANLLKLKGSINVQLRIVKGIPYIFEINPRFSSTVKFRDLFGFKDVLWVLEDQLNSEISIYKKPPIGSKFFKGFNEYIA